MEKTEQHTPAPKAPPESNSDRVSRSALTEALEIASFPAAGLAAYKTLDFETRRAAFKNAASAGLVNDLQKEHFDKRSAIGRRALEATSHGDKALIAKEFSIENTRYRNALLERFEQMGQKSLKSHFDHLHPHQKTGVLVNSLTVAATLVGAVLLVTQNNFVRKLLGGTSSEQER